MKELNTEDRGITGLIKTWCGEPEQGALDQAINLSLLPFVFRHVALMPDTHFGYGMPIGGVVATQGVVSPNMVGVDIGCGMCAVRTSLSEIAEDKLKGILRAIRTRIPVGFNHHKSSNPSRMPFENHIKIEEMPIVSREYDSATYQVGTLGGGNHFIEIQKDEEGRVWIMIHSGSRNLGLQVAKHYNNEAKRLNELWHSAVPVKHDLAFLPLETEEAVSYLEEMNYCLSFAEKNREFMLEVIKEIVYGFTGGCEFDFDVNIHHNYATMENHFGKNVMIHRKGATSAKDGELGIIPGSQGSSSYIVRGKGNRESYMSCSHGAGRKMGRKQAQRSLNLEEEKRKLEEQGILHSIRGVKDLDEASGAYKDIDVVMKEQEDLVEIVAKLRPMAVVKG